MVALPSSSLSSSSPSSSPLLCDMRTELLRARMPASSGRSRCARVRGMFKESSVAVDATETRATSRQGQWAGAEGATWSSSTRAAGALRVRRLLWYTGKLMGRRGGCKACRVDPGGGGGGGDVYGGVWAGNRSAVLYHRNSTRARSSRRLSVSMPQRLSVFSRGRAWCSVAGARILRFVSSPPSRAPAPLSLHLRRPISSLPFPDRRTRPTWLQYALSPHPIPSPPYTPPPHAAPVAIPPPNPLYQPSASRNRLACVLHATLQPDSRPNARLCATLSSHNRHPLPLARRVSTCPPARRLASRAPRLSKQPRVSLAPGLGLRLLREGVDQALVLERSPWEEMQPRSRTSLPGGEERLPPNAQRWSTGDSQA